MEGVYFAIYSNLSNWSRLVQIGLDLSEMVQIGPNWSNIFVFLGWTKSMTIL